ncbi:unnamed protein product [Linum tenue]|uniref:Uncharacterized protein n=1 Tax=Linum tenue TaxID=586396 RepID=A0AAV0RI40_9ROSI|nr:unnamed protein product [Linum tenue]
MSSNKNEKPVHTLKNGGRNQAAQTLGKPFLPESRTSSQTQRPAVPTDRRGHMEQERAAPSVQPSSLEGPCPFPQRECHCRILRHHGIRRRDLETQPSSAQTSSWQSQCSFLGQFCRRKGLQDGVHCVLGEGQSARGRH